MSFTVTDLYLESSGPLQDLTYKTFTGDGEYLEQYVTSLLSLLEVLPSARAYLLSKQRDCAGSSHEMDHVIGKCNYVKDR